MLIKLKFDFPAVFFGMLLAAAIFGMGMLFSSSVPPPSQQIESTSHPKPADESPERAAEQQIAYYTKWLAWFTAALVIVSGVQGYFLLRSDKTARISADAAKLTAEAAIGVEIPRIFIFDLKFHHSDTADDAGTLQFPRISIQLKNYGRTPAFLDRQCVAMRIAPDLPTEPEYSKIADLDPGTVIEKDSVYDLPAARVSDALPTETIDMLLEGKTFIWVYCFVAYRDFLNRPHQFAFGVHYSPARVSDHPRRAHRFIFDAPKKYNESY